MEKFIIDVNGLSKLAVYTNIDSILAKIITYPESLTKTIPADIKYCGEFSEVIEKKDYITIAASDRKIIDVDRKNNIANLFSPIDEFFFPDFVYLAIGMIANDLQKKIAILSKVQ